MRSFLLSIFFTSALSCGSLPALADGREGGGNCGRGVVCDDTGSDHPGAGRSRDRPDRQQPEADLDRQRAAVSGEEREPLE